MTTVGIVGAKGGVGTTTVAAVVALAVASAGTNTDRHVHIVARDDDMAAVLGLPIVRLGETVQVTEFLTLGYSHNDGADVTIEDHGTVGAEDCPISSDDMSWLVIRNDYLSLRRAVSMPSGSGVILISEPGRALGLDDARDVLNVDILELVLDPAVARAIDAGLLAYRVPRSLRALDGIAATILHHNRVSREAITHEVTP